MSLLFPLDFQAYGSSKKLCSFNRIYFIAERIKIAQLFYCRVEQSNWKCQPAGERDAAVHSRPGKHKIAQLFFINFIRK